MKIMMSGLALAVAVFGGAAAAQAAEGDAKKGKRVFSRCAGCHYYNKEKKKLGPNLVGIVGRKVGSVEGYKYSKPFKKIAEGDMVWDEKNLDEYLADPIKFAKKNGGRAGNMRLKLKKEEDRANVIAFLKEEAKAK